jgi:DNA/RNA-binding domain of Phe-tRNA-synthetase-like protein
LLKIDSEVRARYPGLDVLTCRFANLVAEKKKLELEKFKEEVIKEVKGKYTLDSLKDAPTFRAYRDLFWRVGIDPTKTRPAAEALIRRILRDNPIPNINTIVDAYNLASIKTEIALAAFDIQELEGNLVMRFARRGENFLGIGMEKPIELEGGEVVISDDRKLVAIYPHRDADRSKVTEKTRSILLLVCGVPGITMDVLARAATVAIEYITR